MSVVNVMRPIKAPVEMVFDTIAHPENFAERTDTITNIEFLSDHRSGVGTRFKETRIMRGREATTTLEITELVPNKSVRIVSDEGGTIWDTKFTTEPLDRGTILTMEMEARPYKLMAKITLPLIFGMVSKAVASDMDATKAYCEANAY